MADKLIMNHTDSVVLFHSDEYAALLSLLHELQDPIKLTAIAEEHRLMLSQPQIRRISELWSALAQKKPR